MSYCVACLLKLFMWLLQQLRCSNQATFPQSFPGEKQGWLSIQFLFKIKRSQDLVQMCKIYIYTHNYNCIYALLVPRCILDHLSVYVCFLPELAVLGTSGWTSQYHRPHDRHIWPLPPTNRMETEWLWVFQSEILHQKNRENKWNSLQLTTTKTGGNIQLLPLDVSGSENPPGPTAPGAIPGATTRARTNFFQRRVALRQLCKASSKCATKARIISETYTSWLSWLSCLSWLLTILVLCFWFILWSII